MGRDLFIILAAAIAAVGVQPASALTAQQFQQTIGTPFDCVATTLVDTKGNITVNCIGKMGSMKDAHLRVPAANTPPTVKKVYEAFLALPQNSACKGGIAVISQDWPFGIKC